MAVNPTVLLTFLLLFLMMGAGLFSGTWGYSLGRQALRGITQPDSRPSSQVGRSERDADASERGMVFLDESKLIEDVKARISGKPTASDSSSTVDTASSSSTVASPVVDEGVTTESEEWLEPEPITDPVTAEFVPVENMDAGIESATWELTETEDSDASWQPDEAYVDPVDPYVDSAESDPFAEPAPFLDTESN